MPLCAQCKQPITIGDTFCKNCGRKLGKIPVSPIKEEEKTTISPYTRSKEDIISENKLKEKRRKKKVIKKKYRKKEKVKLPVLIEQPKQETKLENNFIVDKGQPTPSYSKTELILQNEMNLIGLQAKPQYPISRMHVDFAFPEKKLVIEVDGPYKRNRQGEESKNRRRGVCESQGWKVLNYTAEEVFENPSLIAYKIKKILERIN